MQSSEWEPSRWRRVVAPDGSLWCETSDEDEARRAMRPGDTLQRLWVKNHSEWRAVDEETPGNVVPEVHYVHDSDGAGSR